MANLPQRKKELRHRFEYHPPPNEAVVKAHNEIREACLNLAFRIIGNTPECREQSLAFTKIEEAMFWSNAAIARNHDHWES